jgi:hypothetical protein
VRKSFTLLDIERLAAQGLIRGYTEASKAAGKGNGLKKGEGSLKATKRGQKIKAWITLNLWHFCRANGFTMKTEVVFHPERKWRADWMITGEGLKVMIEYEGLMSEKSRHTTKAGYTEDTSKYNEAAKMGIIVIRLTALNYKELNRHLEQILNKTV